MVRKAHHKEQVLGPANCADVRHILIVTDAHTSAPWLRQFLHVVDASRHPYIWHDVSQSPGPSWSHDSIALVLLAFGDPTESVPRMVALLDAAKFSTPVTRVCLSMQSDTMPSLLPPIVDDWMLNPLDPQMCHKQINLWLRLDVERRLRCAAERKNAQMVTTKMEVVEQLFSDSPSGFVFMAASDAHIVYQNPEVARIFGQYLLDDGSDWHGWPCFFSTDADATSNSFMTYFTRACAGESFYNVVGFCRRNDGAQIDLRLHASPIRDTSGTIVEVMFDFREMTQERRDMEQQKQLARLLQVLADTSGSHVIMLDPNERYLFANAMHKAWTESRKDGLLGKRLVEILGPEAYWQLRPDMLRAFAGESSASEITLRKSDAQTGLFSVRWEPLRYLNYADGRNEGGILYFRDLAPLRAAQSDAHLSAQRFKTICDELQLIVYTIDNEQGVLSLNRAWTDYTGLDTTGSLGLKWLSVIHPDDIAMMQDLVDASGHQQGVIEYEFRLRNKAGRYEWHLARSLPLTQPDGKCPGQRVGVVVNIHSRKLRRDGIEERLKANVIAGARAQRKWAEERVKVDALQREREAREDFVAALSHDLRTPLTVVRLGVQRLEHKLATDTQLSPIVARMQRSVIRIDSMIRDFLDVSRVRAGRKLILERKPCCLLDLVSATVEELKLLHGNRLLLGASVPIVGMWDSDSLSRVVDNLVGNAIKYGDDSQPITLGLQIDGGNALLSVHNFGDVIPAEQRAKLFERFTRLDDALESSAEGWGIGLQLVAAIAAAHNGSVRIRSEPVEGTTFTLVLPIDAPLPDAPPASTLIATQLRQKPNLLP